MSENEEDTSSTPKITPYETSDKIDNNTLVEAIGGHLSAKLRNLDAASFSKELVDSAIAFKQVTISEEQFKRKNDLDILEAKQNFADREQKRLIEIELHQIKKEEAKKDLEIKDRKIKIEENDSTERLRDGRHKRIKDYVMIGGTAAFNLCCIGAGAYLVSIGQVNMGLGLLGAGLGTSFITAFKDLIKKSG